MAVPRAEDCASAPAARFADFFRGSYREVIRAAMYVGASRDEAEEAAAAIMCEILRHWDKLVDPLAYARRGVVSNFLKEKTRGLDRVRRRQVELGGVTPEGREDSNLTAWEDRQWVQQILRSLSPGQREVMAFVVDGFTPAAIAALLGRSPEAVRRSLCDARRRLKEELRRAHTGEQPPATDPGRSRKGGR